MTDTAVALIFFLIKILLQPKTLLHDERGLIFFFIFFLSTIEIATNFFKELLSVSFLYTFVDKILSIRCVIYKRDCHLNIQSEYFLVNVKLDFMIILFEKHGISKHVFSKFSL